jgi:hypothetical protein
MRQGGDPSAQHEPSTLSVLKNYFFFFAAGFLAATAFFAGFFFAATVLTSHQGLKVRVMISISSLLEPMNGCFIAETQTAGCLIAFSIAGFPAGRWAYRAAAECIDSSLLSDAPRQFKKRFWNHLAQIYF